MNENLNRWIQDNNISAQYLSSNVLEISDFGKFLIVSEKELTFDDRFILNLTDEEISVLDTDVEYLLFKFGSFWFYHHKDSETELNFFRYLGKSSKSSYDLPFLGIHGKYELCNGSRDYIDWTKKAKFLGYKSVGICEHQTLAGSFYFQTACNKSGLKAIHGRTNKIKSVSGTFYYVKSYVKNLSGWRDLLTIHSIEIIKRETSGKYITESELFSLSDNLIHIICHETDLDLVDFSYYDLNNTYFQFNIVEYKNNNKDKEHLLNLSKYLKNYSEKIKPIILQDAYYLDKNDDIVKPLLNKIIGSTTQFFSKDEYLKPFEEIVEQIFSLFKDKQKLDYILESTFEAYSKIDKECNFILKREGRHLPKYIMNENEKLLYKSNEDMFFSLVEQGFKEKIIGKVKNEEIYFNRIQKEIEVLKEGDVIDYFLILYDIYNYLKANCGIGSLGRGSAAGALTSYLLGIVQIDPIEHGLLFERFLNKARLLGGSLPDIDADIPSFFRQSVINFMIEKYGKEQVACIGTAQNFKLKSTLKDLLKVKGVDFSTANFLTSLFTKEYDHVSFDGIFDLARKEKKIKDVIKKYPEIIYEIYLMIFQPRSFGIHAAGVVIAPSEDSEGNKTTIHDYLPCRISDDGQYVTEWEKEAVEEAGMLKEDILGLTQLDKIINVNRLIKENGKSYKEFHEIDFNDPKIMKLFKEAITEDIFQFNTDIQKNYLLQLQPDGINDLIAANALNRPGAMENNSHNKFIKIKHGNEEAYFPPLLEDVLKETYGLFAYQEQAMLSFQIATDCELEESDNFRKVITKLKPGKKNPDIEKYETIFKDAYSKKINDKEVVDKVWAMIIGFATYGFNKSHAASYALTGYWAAYYKAYFPVEFYAVSLQMATDDTLKRLINEIQSRQLVNLSHPDINKSGTSYTIDYDNNYIYWSLNSIKYAGDKAISTLLEDREKNGQYFSFEEFLERSKNFKVNKRIITNFIICGCFDGIENIVEEKNRYKLLKYYYGRLGEEIPEDIEQHRNVDKNHFWIIYQRQLCGLGNINYESIYKSQKLEHWVSTSFIDPYAIQDPSSIDKQVVVGGILEQIIEKELKNGTIAFLQLNCNNEILRVTVWNDTYEKYSDILKESIFQPILMNGVIKFNNYKKINVLQTTNNTKIVKS